MEIHWHLGEELSRRQRRFVETRLERMAEKYGDFEAVRISTRSTGHHRLGGREVKIVARILHHQIVAGRTRSEINEALHHCLEVFEREVRRLHERRVERRRHPLSDLVAAP